MSALTEYDPTEAALADLRHRFGNVVFDLSTTNGDKEARAARKELVGLRTDLESKRKELKAPALERSRLIDAEAARIKGEIEALEEPIDAQIKADEARREAERQAKAAKEAQRISGHQAALDALRSIAVNSVGDDSESLAKTIEMLDATEIGADWEEFQPIAQRAKDDGLTTLRDLHAKAVAAEAEAVRIAAERAELERLRAEQAQAAAAQAQREREAAEQAAAVKRQQDAEAAAARAKIEAEQKAAREAIEAAERESRRKIEEAERAARQAQEAAEAEARKVREAAEAKAKAERDAEETRLRAERQRLEDEQRAAAEVARKAKEAEEARQLAERRERERLLHGREMLEAFVESYADDADFAPIIPAILGFLQPAIREAA